MTPRRKRLKIKPQPVKPVRKKIIQSINLIDGYVPTPQHLLNLLVKYAENGADLENGWFSNVDAEYCGTEIQFHRPETDEEFQSRYDNYVTRKQAWDEWYQSNQQAIDEELAIRREEEADAKRKELEQERKRLEKQAKDSERRAKQLRKQLKELK